MIECYRFVEDNLTSANGTMSWRVGEWNAVRGAIACCSLGLHASARPRDSVRNVYGRRWFLAEARGDIDHQENKFAASEMRLVEEIPAVVLRRFAVGCARSSLAYIGKRRPLDPRVLQCVEATEEFLDGSLKTDDLLEARHAAGAVIASEAALGPDGGRAVAAAMAASCAADGDAASWASAAAGAAHAAAVAADAIDAAAALTSAYAEVHNVARGFATAMVAERAAAAARVAAASGAVAHAAAVAAASGVYAPDTASDAYYAAFSAAATYPVDRHYLAQDAALAELIAASRL
ncbi:hypothetical protein AB0M54_29505 [Actinoplanes sp. NPDC051470]|uniref:DUF7666 domain-containing protein n=1 Tax=unclassified Actinoplanes TaxID=2626549 RepID=UPI0034428B77